MELQEAIGQYVSTVITAIASIGIVVGAAIAGFLVVKR